MSVLSRDSLREVAQLSARIMAESNPALQLQDEVGRLDDAGRLEEAAALFESILFKIGSLGLYWVYYRMCVIYTRIGRDDAALFCANIAIDLAPTMPSWHLYRSLYTYFCRNGRDEEAADAFLRQIERMPENPIVPLAEVRPLLVGRGHPLTVEPTELPTASMTVLRLEEPSFITPLSGRFYGDAYPLHLRPYCVALPRLPVDIVEMSDAQALVYNGNVVICSNDGQPFMDLSVSELPTIIAHYFRSHAAEVEQCEVETAVVVADRFAAPNLCHFLLDHMTRLELYSRLGAKPSEAVVIGPPADTHYQKAILKQLGVTNYVQTTKPCVIRAARLLVSRTCRATHMHPAHGGASWALDYIRDAFSATGGERRNRIYISRTDAKARKIVNEAEVITRLRQAGFVEIAASKLSFAAQVELFRYASHVVSIHGAGLANIVFCPADAHVLEFFHPLYGTWAYGVIGAALGLDYRPLVGRDAATEDPLYNDPDLPDFSRLGYAGRDAAVNRDIRVDLGMLDEWLAEVT